MLTYAHCPSSISKPNTSSRLCVSTWMLRPATSRSLLSTLSRVHVRFLATSLPLKQDRGSPPPPSDPASNVEHAQSIIRQWSEKNSIALRQRTDDLITLMATSFTRLGGEINRVTGYDEIETLKRQVVSQGTSGNSAPHGDWGTQIT